MNTYKKNLAELVQDLINSYDPYLEHPERLPDPNALKRFLRDHDIQPESTIDEADLRIVKELRTQLRTLWESRDKNELADLLNQSLVTLSIVLQVTVGEQGAWQLNYTAPDGLSVLEALKVQSLLGLVAVLEEYGLERMGTCNADPCQDVYIDVSRNRSRRFCSDRCANRYNIAAYRERNQG